MGLLHISGWNLYSNDVHVFQQVAAWKRVGGEHEETEATGSRLREQVLVVRRSVSLLDQFRESENVVKC